MSTPTVSGYGDLEKIGAGGFAAVYRATQTSVGREVALKLLHHAIADEEIERRFQRECRVVGSLSWHPHIAAVLDAGADDEGRSYLAFELLEGGSLGDRLKGSGPVPWAEAVAFAIQTTDALAAAHAEEVLHRDIKPDNILIDRLGRAKLADFGIAQMHDGNQTKSGVINTTLAHAPPEVLNGQRATKISDVYLLGSTLFELIVGEPPFGKTLGNDFFGAIKKISTERPPLLTDAAPTAVPDALATVVERALEKEPSDRFDSAASFGHALREVQQANGLAITSMPFVEAMPTSTPSAPTATPEPSPSPASLPIAPSPAATSAPSPSPASLPIAPSPAATSAPSPSPANLSIAPSPTAPPSTPAAQPIAPQRIDAVAVAKTPTTSRSKLPLVVGGLVVAAVVAVAAIIATRGGESSGSPTSEITAIEVLQTDSQQGQNGDNVIDADTASGWLSPDSPDGHEIVIGFGESVMLTSITVHSGPGGTAALSQARGLGPAVLEFSDGTEMTWDFNESASVETVAIGKQTSSLAIRTVSQGVQPVAIREVEFVGQPAG